MVADRASPGRHAHEHPSGSACLSCGGARQDELGGLVDRVDEVEVVGHRPPGRQRGQGRPHRHHLRPVLAPDEHDDRQRGTGARVVERGGGLEDLLHRAGRALEHDQPRGRPGEQPVLAQRVGEVLADAVAEDVGRLVAVEPRRDADAPDPGFGDRRLHQVVVHGQGHQCPRPDVGCERRHGGEPVERAGRGRPRRGRRPPGSPPPSPPGRRRSRRPGPRPASRWPSSAAPAYRRVPRASAWPPMTPTVGTPSMNSWRASLTESSWIARSRVTNASCWSSARRDQWYARASGVAS